MDEREPKDYFENVFPSLLKEYVQNKPKNDCEHHEVPQARAVWIDAQHHPLDKKSEFLDPFFWLSWYCLTLPDQVIFSSFPEKHALWVKRTGGYPLPMQASGMGCIKVCRADELLPLVSKTRGTKFNANDLQSFRTFLLSELLELLIKPIGLDVPTFHLKYPSEKVLGENTSRF